MSQQPEFELIINNTPDGNCMYYSFATSLVYELRAHYDNEIISKLFKKLGVDESSAETILNIIENTKSADGLFAQEEELTIQRLLAPQLRTCAAEKVIKEYLKEPTAAELYSSASYYFRKLLHKDAKFSDYTLFSEADDLEKAEIFRVGDIKPDMKLTLENRSIEQAKFNKAEIFETEHTQSNTKLTGTITFNDVESREHKIKWLDLFIEDLTLYFFAQKDKKYLYKYQAYLNTDTKWASSETLQALCAEVENNLVAVLEKKKYPHTQSKQNPLGIERFSSDFFSSQTKKEYSVQGCQYPKIILRNQNEIHWVSNIPPRVYLNNLMRSRQDSYETNHDRLEECPCELVLINNLLDNMQTLIDHLDDGTVKSSRQNELNQYAEEIAYYYKTTKAPDQACESTYVQKLIRSYESWLPKEQIQPNSLLR